MAYSFQTFTIGQILTAALVNQIETNIRDHLHGTAGVSTVTGAMVTNTPAGLIAATTVQAAINELNDTITTWPWVDAVAISASDFAAVVASGATAGKTIAVTTNYNITADLTIPSDRQLKIFPGGSLTVSSTKVLTITSQLDAGRYAVFAGAGSVKFTNATSWSDAAQVGYTTTVYPEWWGTDGAAVQTAAYSIAAQTAATTSPTYLGGVVELANRYYALTTTLIIPDHVEVRGPNSSARQACLQATGSWTASNPVVQIGRVLGGQYWSHGSLLKWCSVDANLKAEIGVYSSSVNEESGIDGIIVRNYLWRGIFYEDLYSGSNNRIMHTFIKNVQLIINNLDNVTYYPTPSSVRGIEISGVLNTSTCNFSIDHATIVYAGANAGVGIRIVGVSGVSVTNSHVEKADVDIQIGSATYASKNILVENYDGYADDLIAIQLWHADTTAILLNIMQTDSAKTLVDDNTSGASVLLKGYYLSQHIVGNQYLQSLTHVNRLTARHYDITEQPVGLIFGQSAAGYNLVEIGGGSALVNAATAVRMYTAANEITTTGTLRWTLDSSGNITHTGDSTQNTTTNGFVKYQNATADATDKSLRMVSGHYTNSEKPMGLLYSTSSTSANIIRVGGGTSLVNAATLIEFYAAANNTTTVTTNPEMSIVDKEVRVQRIIPSTVATNLVAGDFALSAGWGTSASVAVGTDSKDQRFEITVTAGTASVGANPTITLTFKDGAFSTAPVPVCHAWNSTTNVGVSVSTTRSTTAPVITLLGTPTINEVYKFSCVFF